MSKPRIERRVLRVFGRMIRPANWTIFIAGILLIPLGISTLWFDLDVKIIGAILISLQGFDFLISGYGEVKDDEDLWVSKLPQQF